MLCSASEPAIHMEVRNCSFILLLLLPWRGDGPVGTKTTAVNVLLFLLRWLQYLGGREVSLRFQIAGVEGLPTWNEHSKLSSTLIIAPALSNSPQ